MPSLFEEENNQDRDISEQLSLYQDIGHGEASSYLPLHGDYRSKLDAYLEHCQAAQLLRKELSPGKIARMAQATKHARLTGVW